MKKEYYEKNKDRINAKRRQRRKNDPEHRIKQNELCKNWVSNNRQWMKDYNKKYCAENSEKKKAQARAAYLNKGLWASARGRAKKKGILFNLEPSDVVIPELCPVFGTPIVTNIGRCGPDSPSIDRIKPELGYVKTNIVVVSHKANAIKSNANLADLEKVLNFYRGLLDA